MQERYSKVNFRKLVKDLADMYPDHTFDVVLTELVANSLDSKARNVSIDWDNESKVLVIADDGHGMTDKQFEEYHDMAAELKSRGSGIGFAGVGAKISFNIASKVITETQCGDSVHASDWHWSGVDSLVWSDIKPSKLSHVGTRVEVHFNQDQIPGGVNSEYLAKVLWRHYLPLFITEFVRAYQAIGVYKDCPEIRVNGVPMPQGELDSVMGLKQIDRFPVKNGSRSIGLGAIGLAEDDSPIIEDGYGVLLCTHGKVIKPETFGLRTGPLGAGLSGIVEIPDLIQFVTTNKSDLKGGRGRNRELEALLHPVCEKLKEFLAKHGVAPVEQKQDKLSASLERELTKMVKNLPELQDFDGLLSKSRRLRRSESGNITAALAERERDGVDDGSDAGRNSGGNQEARNREGDGRSRGPIRDDPQGREQAKRRKSRNNQGPRVAFEEHSGRAETAWLDSSTIIINSGHDAYRQRITQDQAKLTYCMFAIGVALDKAGLAEPVGGVSYVDRLIGAWGAS